MSNDLGTVLGRAVAELSPTGDPDQLVLSRVRRAVRRRRVQRHTVESVVGVAAAGVVGTAAWAGLRLTTPPPAVAPTQSATPPTASPSASAGPSVSPTETATASPTSWAQPSSVPVTPAVLTRATAGWVLSVYEPTYLVSTEDGGDEAVDTGPAVLYLVSPTGDRYRMFDAGPDRYWVVHWTAGEQRALVALMDDGPYRWLDLRTGALSLVDGVAADDDLVARDRRGHLVFQTGDGRLRSIAPDGTSTLVDVEGGSDPGAWRSLGPETDLVADSTSVVDVRTGRRLHFRSPEGSTTCEPLGLLPGSTVVLGCVVPGTGVVTYTAALAQTEDAAAATPAPLPYVLDGVAPGSVERGVLPFGDGRLVVRGTDLEGVPGVFVVDGSTVSQVWRASSMVETAYVDVSGSRILLTVDADDTPTYLAVYDDSTGATSVLMPLPPDPGGHGLGPGWWSRGMTSWVVATAG
jgi:hypothetical protein